MPRLSAITSTTKSIIVESELFGCKVAVKYYPGKFTPEFEQVVEAAVMQALQTNQPPQLDVPEDQVTVENPPKPLVNFTCQSLAGLLDSWDITDDNEINIEPTPENLMKVPYPILHGVFSAIKDDMSPKQPSSSS